MEAPGEDPAVMVIIPPMEVFYAKAGLYGITYDLYTNAIEKPPPYGWRLHRSICILTLPNFYCLIRSFKASYIGRLKNFSHSMGFNGPNTLYGTAISYQGPVGYECCRSDVYHLLVSFQQL